MVFQQPIAFPHSIEKNLSYVLKYHGVRNKKEIAEKITESLQKAKLYDEVKDQLKKSALKLSGGQKQRLAIACALMSDKRFIVLDEPTSGLDRLHMTQVGGLLRKLADRGKAVLVVTHDYELAALWCDRIIALEDELHNEQGEEEDRLAWTSM